MQKAALSALPAVRALGRHAGRDPLTLYWSASGIELLFDGSELWVDFHCEYDVIEPWVSVELDGACYARFAPSPGDSRVCLFRGMAPGTPKHLRLLKDVQAMPNDPRHLLQITALEYDGGTFLPLPEPKLRLEFVGDSITSGEGAIGAQCETDWVGAFFSAENNYARMTADALGAEYRVVSQSGWGTLCDWQNNPNCVLPRVYTPLCAAQPNAPDALRDYDFAAWPADAVIINLGTNDEGAFRNPPWHDPATGAAFKLHLLPDGSFAPADAARLAQAVCDFLTLLRGKNPQAALVWCFGMLGGKLLPVLQNGVDLYKKQSGDTRVYLLPLPAATAETLGAREHPGTAAHRAAAEVLTAFLQEVL
ncbi:GDSL-type esterase/lipase family protein [Gemmiger sp.]